MNIMIRTIVLLSATLCTLTAYARPIARVYLPFGFMVKHQMFPAGNYLVELDASRNFITLANTGDVHDQVTATAVPGETSKSPAVLTFDVCGGTHVLRDIHVGDWQTRGMDGHDGRGSAVCLDYAIAAPQASR